MRENMQRLQSFQRLSTQRTLGDPATIVLGITANDFGIGVLALTLVSFLPTFYAPFLALGLAVFFVFLSTQYRKRFPKKHLAHVLWASGLFKPSSRTVFPSPFWQAKRRFVSFIPK